MNVDVGDWNIKIGSFKVTTLANIFFMAPNFANMSALSKSSMSVSVMISESFLLALMKS